MYRAGIKDAVLMLMSSASVFAFPALAQSNPSIGVKNAVPDEILLEQAEFWESEGRFDLALQSLERVLTNDPDNIEALSHVGELRLKQGDLAKARSIVIRLKDLPGASSVVEQLESEIEVASLDMSQVRDARNLANAGDYNASVRLYERLFEGRSIPDRYAIEYYLTMAGIDSRWPEAMRAMQALADRRPENSEYALAAAQILSYREETRRDALRRLRVLSQQPRTRQAALNAMRETLSWLGARPEDISLYEAYLEERPDDVPIRAKLDAVRNPQGETLVLMLNQEGYDQLEVGDVESAEQSFAAALDEDSTNAQSLAGLGIVRGRQERFSEAAELLREAMRRDPVNRLDFVRALNSVSFWADMQDARRAKELGELGTARRILETIEPRSESERAELAILRGEIAMEMEAWTEARQHYAEAYQITPENGAGFIGLLSAMTQGSSVTEVEYFLASERARNTERFGEDRLRAAAAKARGWIALKRNDLQAASGWYSIAIELDPSDPWVRLEAARLMAQTGGTLEAESLFSGAGLSADPQLIHAAALFYAGQEQWDKSYVVLRGVPSDLRTPGIRDMLGRAELRENISRIQLRHSPRNQRETRQALLGLYSPFDTHPDDSQLLAATLIEIGSEDAAIAILRQSSSMRDSSEVKALADNASLLISAEDLPGAKAILDQLQLNIMGMSNTQLAQVATVYDTYTVALARHQMEQGSLERARMQVALVLEANPVHSPALRTAAEIEVRSGRFDHGLAKYKLALDLDPGDREALRGAVGAAIQGGRFRSAADLLDAALLTDPDDPVLYSLVADLGKASGDIRTAIEATEKARQLELAQQGMFSASGPAGPDGFGGSGNPFRNAERALTPQRNPFAPTQPDASTSIQPAPRPIPMDTATDIEASFMPAGVVRVSDFSREQLDLTWQPGILPYVPGYHNDMVLELVQDSQTRPEPRQNEESSPEDFTAQRFRERLREIEDQDQRLPDPDAALPDLSNGNYDNYDWQIAELQARSMPSFGAGLGFRYRTGDEGLSQLTELETPAEMGLPIGDGLTFTAQPAYLSSGVISDSPFELRRLGTLGTIAADERQAPDSISDAGGVALSAKYELGGLEAEIGMSPIGYEVTNIVGNVAFRHNFENGVGFNVKASREPVTDSVLSYAGVEDPVTGEVFGGAVDNRISGGVSLATTSSSIYANVAMSSITGERIKNNTGFQFDTGALFDFFAEEDRSLRTGLTFTYFGYEENRRYFTLGHGGYFSPQQFMTAQVPVEFEIERNRIRLAARGALGFQYFSEDAAPFFPYNPELTADLIDVAVQDAEDLNLTDLPDIEYDAMRETNLALSAGADFSYRITPTLAFEALARLDRVADYTEVQARFGLRHLFEGLDLF